MTPYMHGHLKLKVEGIVEVPPQDRELNVSLIERVLHYVQKPSRYIGLELNTAMRPWTNSLLRICLAFPETYEIGMSHLGLQVLYRILNSTEGVSADRAYCPWPDMEDSMRRAGIPLWGIESRRPLRAFDIIGFSLQNELLYTNMLTMLDLAGIPHLSSDRTDDDPLVISGGPCASNPEPYAPFIDAVCIGDGEELVRDVALLSIALKKEAVPRERRLTALAAIEGIYVPSLYEANPDECGRLSIVGPLVEDTPVDVKRRIVTELDARWIPEPPLVSSTSPVQERLSLEVSRGCTWGCRFCHAGYYQRPLRERDPVAILSAAERGIASSGFDEVNLLSLSTADYSALKPLMDGLLTSLAPLKVALALPSLRINSMSGDIAEKIRRVKKTGFTFAPEAGTQRLRNVINKVFSDEDILAAADSAFKHGWNLVKLYFMIGLPTETDDDVDGIIDLVRRIEKLPSLSGRGKQLNVSIGAFVPKPHTAFQWEPFDDVSSLAEKLARLKASLQGRKVKVKWQHTDASFLEAALSRGDRHFARVIKRAWLSGARFDSWTDMLDTAVWKAAFEAEAVDPLLYCGSWKTDGPQPWDVINSGLSRKFLLLERERALREETTEDCRTGACQGCGLPGAPSDNRLVDPELPVRGIAKAGAAVREPRLRRNLRICYSVTGLARFLTHLDRGGLLRRAILRDDLEPIHTSGFSPRPKMALGPPLPLGVYSTVELVDFLVGGPHTEAVLRTRLSEGFPAGMTIETLSLNFQENVDPLSEIQGIWYEFDFSTAPPAIWEAVSEKLDVFFRASRFDLSKEKKGKVRTVDLKRAITVFEALQGSHRKFTMHANHNDPEGQNAGPRDVIEGILELSPSELTAVKIIRSGYSSCGGVVFPRP